MRTFGMCVASVAGVLCLASYVPAATLSLKIEPTTCTTVSPNGTVNYCIKGTLTNDGNLGLATFGVDLQTTTGIPQQPANSVDDTKTFAPPFGYNPGGFGGTPDGGNLLQIGGAQNTIGHAGTSPKGTLVTNVALGTEQVLAVGQVTLPLGTGTYTISISQATAFAGVLLPGPVYPVDLADVAVATPSFTVTVGSSPAAPLQVTAGANVEWVYEDQPVALEATVGNPNGYTLTYAWVQTAGGPPDAFPAPPCHAPLEPGIPRLASGVPQSGCSVPKLVQPRSHRRYRVWTAIETRLTIAVGPRACTLGWSWTRFGRLLAGPYRRC